ncbi:MAG TPA: FAD-binding protein [Gaiellaceae bacterium]|nr:FAD-binding protein [Gaiellaceae bacterium]
MIAVAGAGLAGLVTAARLRELGVGAVVHEKGTRAGGSMLLSSGVPWRHRDWDDFRRECPDGDERLQRLVWERLDDGLEWLRSLGAPVVAEETGNPLTVGKRFDPRGLTEALAARAGDVRLESADWGSPDVLVLCTGGFAASTELVARHVAPAAPLRLRGNPWSTGDGLLHALGRGAAQTGGMDEFYGRNMPDAPWGEGDFVGASQLYARHARIVDEHGVEFFRAEDVSWSETNVVQATAHRPGARAYYLLDEAALGAPTRYGTVADAMAAAPEAARVPPDELPFAAPPGIVAAVRVVASITHTIGGLRVDERARVLRDDGTAVEGLYAAGVDAGGVATGGYASGLAQALVLGLTAAESIAAA